MSKLYTPTRDTITGPWFLDQEALEELDKIIELASSLLESAFERHRESTKHGLLMTQKVVEVEIVQTKRTKYITDRTIKAILKDKNILDFKPESLNIYVGYRLTGIEFQMNFTNGIEGKIKYHINCKDEELEYELNYELDKWITKHKPSRIYRLLASVYPTVMILGGLILLIAWLNTLQSTDYQTSLKRQSHQLLDSGVTQSNLNKAIELLLKLKSEYNDKNFVSENYVDNNALSVAVLITIVYFVFSLFPRSILGIGKNKFWLRFYKNYKYVFVPFLVSSVFLPKIVEWISKLF